MFDPYLCILFSWNSFLEMNMFSLLEFIFIERYNIDSANKELNLNASELCCFGLCIFKVNWWALKLSASAGM